MNEQVIPWIPADLASSKVASLENFILLLK
jgi:hypothetical protein